MDSIREYAAGVLQAFATYDEVDEISKCDCELAELLTQPDKLLKLADDKLHVFPFKEVKPCWFHLYTDASIVKALQLLQSASRSDDALSKRFDDYLPRKLDDGQHRKCDELLGKLDNGLPRICDDALSKMFDEAVALLDMALIMAGGVGREEMIHEILSKIGEALRQHDEAQYAQQDARPSKRRRLSPGESTAVHQHDTSLPTDDVILPENEVSVPKLLRPVSTINQPSLEEFQEHMKSRRPVILTRTLQHWPALQKWKQVGYWRDKTLQGRRLVPVELGRSYVDDDWGQKIMPFKQFLEEHILKSRDDADYKTGYLAQHDLFKQILEIAADVAAPDYCYLDAPPPEPGTPLFSRSNEEHAIQSNIWFGPAWTVSPLHHDPYHNILCQVVGKKYVRLYSPHHSSKLFPRSKNEPAPHSKYGDGPTIDMSNTSTLDIAAMELSPDEDWDENYPGISQVPYVECELEAGQALYIPVGWWHYVRSCSAGISVSFWW